MEEATEDDDDAGLARTEGCQLRTIRFRLQGDRDGTWIMKMVIGFLES